MTEPLAWKSSLVPNQGDLLVVWERPYCARDLELLRADGILVRVERVVDDQGRHAVQLAAWTAAIIIHDDAIVTPTWEPDGAWSGGNGNLIALPVRFALGTRYLLMAFQRQLAESKASEATLLQALEAIGRGTMVTKR